MSKNFYRSFFLLLVFSIPIILSSIAIAQEAESPSFRIKGENLTVGAETASSSSYSVTADMNPFSDLSSSSNFKTEIGYNPRIRANTPYAPLLENPDNSYDRLVITVDPSDNPDDTFFAVIISTDDFASFAFVQNDGTVGDTLGMEDYRTYDSWGGIDGSYILGLTPSTTYEVRIKALQGDFTETSYGPASPEASTTEPYVNMSISHSALTLGTLNVNSISQTTGMTVTVNTNAYSGYQVYVSDQGNGSNGGLYNGSGSLILSADMTLTAGVAGYGAQANSATAYVDPKYDLFGNTIGGLGTSSSPLFSNTMGVTGESTTVLFKAAMSPTTIAGEYSDIVYYTVTPNL